MSCSKQAPPEHQTQQNLPNLLSSTDTTLDTRRRRGVARACFVSRLGFPFPSGSSSVPLVYTNTRSDSTTIQDGYLASWYASPTTRFGIAILVHHTKFTNVRRTRPSELSVDYARVLLREPILPGMWDITYISGALAAPSERTPRTRT